MSVANGGDTPLRTISNQDIRDNSWHRGYRGRQANGPKLISSIGGAPEALSAVRMVIEILAGVGGRAPRRHSAKHIRHGFRSGSSKLAARRSWRP